MAKSNFLSRSRQTYSGDWLLALPIASCGLRLDDEAVRVAAALQLGLGLCAAHTCRCGVYETSRLLEQDRKWSASGLCMTE